MLVQEVTVNSETVALQNAFKRISATAVFSPLDHPYFDNSAVDGYGIRFADLQKNSFLQSLPENMQYYLCLEKQYFLGLLL